MKHVLPFFWIVLFLLFGCAAGQSLEDMKKSGAAYKACLARHPMDTSSCKQAKEVYEEAGQAYEGRGDGGNTLDTPTSR